MVRLSTISSRIALPKPRNQPSGVRFCSTVWLIESVTVQHPRVYWTGRFEANDLPCGPINNYEEVFADPHVQATPQQWAPPR